VLVVGVGAAVMVGGLETPAGEERVETTDVNTTEITTSGGDVVNVTTSETTTADVTTTYEPIGTTSSFPTGLVVTLLGGVMTLRAVEGSQL
jgi:predicted flavoprotein YhiN